MRTTFINWLCKKAEEDKRIVLLTGDLGYGVIEPFASQFPNRFINVGVAEQNMVGIASGLASEGFLPFTYSIGIFPTFRCAEQIRNDIDYHNLPIVTTSVGSGVTYGALGYTHHAIQDLALMRSLPNMIIATPSDPLEVEAILDWQLINKRPIYLRMHKAGEPNLHKEVNQLNPGKPLKLSLINKQHKINHTCILTCGYLAKELTNILNRIDINFDFYTIPLWGQKSKKSLSSFLKGYENIITIEDHLLDGGFGSYVLETATQYNNKCNIIPISLTSDSVGKVASEKTLIEPILLKFEKVVKDFIDI